MGTTLVVALWHDNRISVGHVGDSRLYRLRDGKLSQVTRDHSLLQEQIDSGMITKAQARHSQNKNLVTRAVGIDPDVETEVHSYPVLVGDIYLMCSDGLNDMVTDEDIELTLSSLAEASAMFSTAWTNEPFRALRPPRGVKQNAKMIIRLATSPRVA